MEKDWRLGRDQEDYLKNENLVYKSFKSKLSKDDINCASDHHHCEFCWHRFMEDSTNVEDCSTEGYCTTDERIWICKTCYTDFKDLFNWTII